MDVSDKQSGGDGQCIWSIYPIYHDNTFIGKLDAKYCEFLLGSYDTSGNTIRLDEYLYDIYKMEIEEIISNLERIIFSEV